METRSIEVIIEKSGLGDILRSTSSILDRALGDYRAEPRLETTGTIERISRGIATVRGLPGIKAEELVRFPGNIFGLAFNIDHKEIGIVLLGESSGLKAGMNAGRTNRVQDAPVGAALLGRVVNPLGMPLDNKGPARTEFRFPIEREAPDIMDRDPVTAPIQTGLKVVDALIPIGKGQRELILGDRQTGKTAIAVDCIINQKDNEVVCIYCAVGKRSSAVASVVADLKNHSAMENSIVVVSTEDDPPGLQFITPYAATSMAEYFMEQGRDVLIVYDDLTRHARAYRELSLLLRRPPGREAYPGDIFYIHSRLLERSTHLNKERGGGSLTALPIVETQAQNISAYIPTNLISITDGQIYLSSDLFQKGILPAVDVGKSVSRVGGKAQLPAYRMVASDLRLSYSQFEELEGFARFGTRLDEETRNTLEHGRRVREILKQSQYRPIPVPEQIAVLFAVNNGLFDGIPIEKLPEVEQLIRNRVSDLPEIVEQIQSGEKLSDAGREALLQLAVQAAKNG